MATRSKLKSNYLAFVDSNDIEYIVHDFERQGLVAKTKDQLKNALSRLGSSDGTIVIVDNINIDEDITIPENICLKFFKGGKLTVLTKDPVTVENVGTGDGSTTTFTLSEPPVLDNSEKIYINGVEQTKGVDYTINYLSGTITFTNPPADGDVITVDYTPQHKLTIDGYIDAGMFHIFDGDGRVIGNSRIEAVYPEWFGAVGDGEHDDTEAIQRAISTGKNVILSDKTYYVSQTFYQFPNQIVKGSGIDITIIKSNAIPIAYAFADENGNYDVRTKNVTRYSFLSDLTIEVLNSNCSGLQFISCQQSGLKNIKIKRPSDPGSGSRDGTGVLIASSDKDSGNGTYYNFFENVKVEYFKEGIVLAGFIHSNSPLLYPNVWFCDYGIIVDSGEYLGYMNTTQPAIVNIINPDVERITNYGIWIRAGYVHVDDGYFEHMVDGIRVETNYTVIISGRPWFNFISNEKVNRIHGVIYSEATKFSYNQEPVSYSTYTKRNLKLTKFFKPDTTEVTNISFVSAIELCVSLTGDGTNSYVSKHIDFADYGLPSLNLLGVFPVVYSTTTGGNSNSLYNVSIGGLDFPANAKTGLDVYVRTVDGSAIPSDETIGVALLLIICTYD